MRSWEVCGARLWSTGSVVVERILERVDRLVPDGFSAAVARRRRGEVDDVGAPWRADGERWGLVFFLPAMMGTLPSEQVWGVEPTRSARGRRACECFRLSSMCPADDSLWMYERLAQWFSQAQRPLVWRRPGTSAWGVLLSEVMSQQTPVARVEPMWLAWMERWPSPTDLAHASAADVLAAWGRLGYPRRALRLHECAQVVRDEYGGQLPSSLEVLQTLPGVGSYTAAAVSSFAFHQRAVVLDTNIRRVFARFYRGCALPPPSPRASERNLAARVLPRDAEDSVLWNVSVMELGALVCKARSALCEQCPISERCQWLRLGSPADEFASRRRTQAWHGTDRQARGRIMALLRDHAVATHAACLRAATIPGGDVDQPARVLVSLLEDGLIHRRADGDYGLGSESG